jgi:acetyl esterase/lipase
MYFPFALSIVIASPNEARAQTPASTSYDVVSDVPYNTLDAAQTLTVYAPPEERRRSVAVFVLNHGSGDKGPIVHRLAERGHPVFFVNVRARDGYPRPVEDAFCALAWLHANAGEYGVDPRRIVALGHSGGAVLAAHLGTVGALPRYLGECPHPIPAEQWLLGVVSIAGIFDYRTEEEFGASHNAYTPRYFGGSKLEVPELWEEASPITWLDGNEPPFLVVHGTADTMVRLSQSERSVSILRNAGVEVQFVSVPGADHDTILGEEAFAAIEAFLDRLSESPER